MRYILSERANRDIRKITDFIRKDNPQAAEKVAVRILEAIRRIAEHPNVGHVHSDIQIPALRVYRVYSYLIVHKVEAKVVKIVSVVHGARDLKRIFRKG